MYATESRFQSCAFWPIRPHMRLRCLLLRPRAYHPAGVTATKWKFSGGLARSYGDRKVWLR
jgi:hypothetical protein